MKPILLGPDKGTRFDFLLKISEMDPAIWEEAYLMRTLEDENVELMMKRASVTIVLGHGVREHLSLPEVPWILPQRTKRWTWRLLPYPSGRTQTYNDPVFRAATRLMLQELATR